MSTLFTAILIDNHEGEGLEKFLHSLFIKHWCKAVISTLQQTQFCSIDLRLNCELPGKSSMFILSS